MLNSNRLNRPALIHHKAGYRKYPTGDVQILARIWLMTFIEIAIRERQIYNSLTGNIPIPMSVIGAICRAN